MGSELPSSTVNSVGTPLRPGISEAEPEVRIVSLVFFKDVPRQSHEGRKRQRCHFWVGSELWLGPVRTSRL